jgi:hypothetical protein
VAGLAAKRDDVILGLVPIVVGLVFGVLLLPRRAVPEEVPTPIVDGRALGAVHAEDARLAAGPLPGEIREVGSAIREFNTREAKQETQRNDSPAPLNEARLALDRAVGGLDPANRDAALLALRATQLEGFVTAVRAFVQTGDESAELLALGGPFVRRLREVGWCHGHALAMDDDVLRVMFKAEWNTLVGVDRPPFALTLDEQRVLYAFYFRHPHAPASIRKKLDDARATARDAKACDALVHTEAIAAEDWRIEKIKRLRAIDPAYPAPFALGIAYYRRGEFNASAQQLHDWIDAHPDGPWTIRARHYLREAVYQSGLD